MDVIVSLPTYDKVNYYYYYYFLQSDQFEL